LRDELLESSRRQNAGTKEMELYHNDDMFNHFDTVYECEALPVTDIQNDMH